MNVDGSRPLNRLGTALLGIAVLAAGIRAQTAAPEELGVSELLRRLRDPASQPDERAPIVEQLARMELGVRPLYDYAAQSYRRHDRLVHEAIDAHLRLFGRMASKALAHKQGGRRGLARIETLRETAMQVSRGSDLTADRIRAEIDPAVAALAELVMIAPGEVIADSVRMQQAAAKLDADLERLDELHAMLTRATDAMRLTAAGRSHLERQKPTPPPRERQRLADERAFLALLATPMSKRDAEALIANRELQAGLDVEEGAGVRALNLIRLQLGLGVVAIDVGLCKAARGHSDDMRRLGFFSHASPVPGKEDFGKRAALEGTGASAENIAVGTPSGPGAIRMWWYSPGHHRNMLGGATRVGLGRSESHWTQMFGG